MGSVFKKKKKIILKANLFLGEIEKWEYNF